MPTYKYKTEDGERADCNSCGWPAPLAKFEDSISGDRWLCEVCAQSQVGIFTKYPTQYEYQTREIGIAIAQVANLLLDKLGKR